MKQIFADIYKTNGWSNDESVSGHGSSLSQTATIRKELPVLFGKLGVKTILDIPCGDFFWFSKMWPELNLHEYLGIDIVPEIVEKNIKVYGQPGITFATLDITQDRLPGVDLILCRDLLGHFSNRDIKLAISNLKFSGSTYLLATTFPGRERIEIKTGQWRPIDLASLYGLPDPILLINEKCPTANGLFKDKSLGLWRLQNGD